jgi:predicted nucleotidyltransferase
MNNLFVSIPGVEKVILYGSRARGDHRLGSDVDLAIFGDNITRSHIANIHDLLENESPALLFFDVLHYNTLTNEALKKEIDKYGKVIYLLI